MYQIAAIHKIIFVEESAESLRMKKIPWFRQTLTYLFILRPANKGVFVHLDYYHYWVEYFLDGLYFLHFDVNSLDYNHSVVSYRKDKEEWECTCIYKTNYSLKGKCIHIKTAENYVKINKINKDFDGTE